MSPRFTERANRVLRLAQEEARVLRHPAIGTEHILLGILREGDSVAARALTSLGVNVKAVRDEVRKIIKPGEAPAAGDIGLTPRAKRVLELA
ncbi:MAG: ATP-dependent Clp protease ATP-binding subunit ClpC, partial [Moorella sp. (in: Bacteria)]|nr:ATP-dependent Clp protease ATP-binding subunit ClpC [Moorella sp. (in: firmicutes)]